MGDRAPEERLLIELAIAAPLETVWRAIREPAIIRNWFGWDADTLTDEIEYIFVQHAEPFEAAHMLQFGTWEGAADPARSVCV